MSNYNTLKATIDANVKQNGNQAITGSIMNSVLNQMVTTLGAGYQYMGVAIPTTNPGTPDAKVCYVAATPGTYTNFKNSSNVALEVADGEVAILKYDTSWSKEVTGAATAAQVTQLGQKIDEFSQGKFYGYFSDADELPTGGTESGFAYVGTAAPFEVWNYDGSAWSDSGVTIDRIPLGNGEDIDSDADGLLQFANRSAAQGQMGYKILRPDSSFAAQVTDADTIYEIRYPFDLNGSSVTIPAGCVLKFNGGELNNGTLSIGGGCSVLGNDYEVGNAKFSVVSNDYIVKFNKCKFVGITGIAIDKNVSSATTNTKLSLIISNCSFIIGNNGIGIRLVNAREAEITECIFEGNFNGSKGVQRIGSVNTTVTNCMFSKLTYAIQSGETGVDSPYNAGLIVSSCTALGCSVGIESLNEDSLCVQDSMIDFCNSPIRIIGTKGVRISSNYISNRDDVNTISGNNLACIYIAGDNEAEAYVNDVIISENSLINHTTTASNIKVDVSSFDINIVRNYIGFINLYGIEFFGSSVSPIALSTIDGNIFTTTVTPSAFIYSTNGLTNSMVISNNRSNKETVPLASLNGGRGNAKYYANLRYYYYDTVDHVGTNQNETYVNNGRPYFRTDLNMPFWVNASNWYNAMGFKRGSYGEWEKNNVIIIDGLDVTKLKSVINRTGKHYLIMSDVDLNSDTIIGVANSVYDFCGGHFKNGRFHLNGGRFVGAYENALSNINLTGFNANQGTTADRPSPSFVGAVYFDTDLGKPVWWSGSNWVDATGTTV